MSVTKKDVEYIARLAKLNLSESELDSYTKELNSILDYAAKLNELDTEGVPPLSHPVESNNVFREDVQKECLTTGEALKNAPKKDDKFFKVPKVIG